MVGGTMKSNEAIHALQATSPPDASALLTKKSLIRNLAGELYLTL